MNVLTRKATPIPKTPKNPKGAGRPSDYRPVYSKMAFRLALLGATKLEMADALSVNEDTIYQWIKRIPEFAEAIKKGGIEADSKVAHAMYKRALGYKHRDTDIKVIENQIVMTNLTKHYPPDTTAAFIWLKNRRVINGSLVEDRAEAKGKEPVRKPSKPLQWRDKVEQEITGPGGIPVGTVNQDERAKQTRQMMLKELDCE